MKAVVTKSVAKGTIQAPPSKSFSHRALIAAGLSDKESVIEGVLESEDIYATLDGLKALGATYFYEDTTIRIKGAGRALKALDAVTEGVPVNCRESGSTLRFLLPLFLLGNKKVQLEGYGRLFQRPMKIYEEICKEQELLFQPYENGITIQGPLKAGSFKVPGNVSSQFITGLFYALSMLEEDSTLELIPPVESFSYILMTLEVLKDFGVEIRQEGNVFHIPGNSRYEKSSYVVEGDYSNAAFLEGFQVLNDFYEKENQTDLHIQVENLKENSLQGDRIYKEYYVNLKRETPYEDRKVLDLQDCPDLGPVLMALAACTGGAAFANTRRLKIKESDRGQAMAQELKKFGITVECEENHIRVLPGVLQTPAEELDSHNDHRIAMAVALVCTLTGGTIGNAECVSKSYPGFWKDIKRLGIGVELL